MKAEYYNTERIKCELVISHQVSLTVMRTDDNDVLNDDVYNDTYILSDDVHHHAYDITDNRMFLL